MNLLGYLECRSRFIPDKRKDNAMISDRRRILELALESLQNRKKQLDAEIAEITRELRGGTARTASSSAKSGRTASPRKRSRFSKKERLQRSKRMTAYWENWRKQKARKKK